MAIRSSRPWPGRRAVVLSLAISMLVMLVGVTAAKDLVPGDIFQVTPRASGGVTAVPVQGDGVRGRDSEGVRNGPSDLAMLPPTAIAWTDPLGASGRPADAIDVHGSPAAGSGCRGPPAA